MDGFKMDELEIDGLISLRDANIQRFDCMAENEEESR